MALHVKRASKQNYFSYWMDMEFSIAIRHWSIDPNDMVWILLDYFELLRRQSNIYLIKTIMFDCISKSPVEFVRHRIILYIIPNESSAAFVVLSIWKPPEKRTWNDYFDSSFFFHGKIINLCFFYGKQQYCLNIVCLGIKCHQMECLNFRSVRIGFQWPDYRLYFLSVERSGYF